VDDLDKSASFGDGEAPRRSTSTLEAGVEYDAAVFRSLETALQALGYQMSFESWGVERFPGHF
jgi:hypothetical protein